MAIILRQEKGSPLSFDDLDNNFIEVESLTDQAKTSAAEASADAAQVALDVIQTSADAAQVALDVIQTSADATASSDSAQQAANDAASANGNPLGAYANNITFNSHNDYVSESGLFRLKESINTPYTTNTGTYPLATDDQNLAPWSSVDELETVAISLNTPRANVTYDALGEIAVGYIYSPSQQKTYAVPADAQGKGIKSVVGNVLETGDLTLYTMTTSANRELASISEMIATNLSVGDKCSTGTTQWRIVSSGSASGILLDNGNKAIALNGVWMGDFLIAEGEDFSVELRLAINSGEWTVHLPRKRFKYDGAVISAPVVKIKGQQLPTVNTAFNSLENGSVIEGTISFSSLTLHLENFGVDVGAATPAAAGDGLKCTAPINAGKHLHIENVVSLLKSETSPYHAIVLESYKKVTGGNLSGNMGLFGVVIKCQNVNIGSVCTARNGSDGLYLKSDVAFGTCKNVNINKVIIDGNGTQQNGIRVQATDKVLENVNIDSVIIDGCETPIFAQTTDMPLTQLNIGKAILHNPTSRGVYSQAGTGVINGFHISELFIINATNIGVEYFGVNKGVSIGHADIVYATGTSQADWDKGVVVGSSVSGTSFDSVNINQLYSSVNLGAIKYENSTFKDGNSIGVYKCSLKGAGKPVMGVSFPVDTGAAVSLTPSYNRREKSSVIKHKPTAATVIESINYIVPDEAELYDTGYELTIINDSAHSYTVNNSLAGKILNRGGSDVIVPPNETVRYVFGGAVWHQQ